MSNTLLIGLSEQMALRRQADVIANNLANMNTTAFKSEGLVFQEVVRQIETENGTEDISFVLDFGLNRDTSVGASYVTNNPLDFSFKNRGFFAIGTPEGERYTRNGQFGLDENGQLVTRDGLPVLDVDDNPITISSTASNIVVDQDGTIFVDNRKITKFKVVDFADQRTLQKTGSGLYMAGDQKVEEVLKPNIIQGAIETSNVVPILEMTKLIETLRSYESAGKLMESSEETTLSAVKSLGQQV